MKQYFRYGHADQLFVKVGDKIKKGQKIGTVGKGGVNNFSAHIHFDIPLNKLPDWTAFVIGKSKEWVAANYANPEKYKLTVLPNYTHEGLDYLQFWKYPNGAAYHPGDDLNSGGGDTDFGDPFYSATDGVVIYAYSGVGSNNGWGKLLVIEEVDPEVSNPSENIIMVKELQEAIEKVLGEDFGKELNESEQKKVAKKLLELNEASEGTPVLPELRDALKMAHDIEIGKNIDPQDQRLMAERLVSLKKSEAAEKAKVENIKKIVG